MGSGIFRPDPMAGFPPGAAEGEASLNGTLHLVFGGIGFLALASAGLLLGAGFAPRDLGRPAALSRGGSLHLYRWMPHPDPDRRVAPPT